MSEGICRLCLRQGALQRSHIIPNALFRRIKQRNSGKLIQFDDSPTSIAGYSIESWTEPFLCEDCEQWFSGLEHATLETLRKPLKGLMDRRDGVLLGPIDFPVLKMFFTSLVWRSAVSTLAPFVKVALRAGIAEDLRTSLLAKMPLPPNILAFRLQLLFDPTPASRGGFRTDNLQQLIISPIARIHLRYTSFIFLLEGYLLEAFVPGAPHRVWKELGVLKDEKKLYVPGKNIFYVPELRSLLVEGHRKIVTGRSTVK